MPLNALNPVGLVRPIAEQLREQAPLRDPSHPDWAVIDRDTCSALELAEVWRCAANTAVVRISRMHESFLMVVPSRRLANIDETRVIIRKLAKNEQSAIRRLRRANESSVARHPGGEVQRDDDGRLTLTPAEREVVRGLWLKRHCPTPVDVMRELVRDCIRCSSAPMQLLARGERAINGSARCANPECGLQFAFKTVQRLCSKVAPEAAAFARKGRNEYVNRFGIHRPQPAANFHRNERVYGDHHQLDILLWDEADLQCHLTRWWISAWQDKATGVVAFRLGRRANADLLSLAFRAYVQRWGLPESAWTDNGKDYISAQFTMLCKHLSVVVHHTLPSKRTGESHGKSKPIERWFGTLERGFVKALPGWCGTHPKERPDDVLWPMEKAHEKFVAHERGESPFLSVQQFEQRLAAWVEEGFHKDYSATAHASPIEAFTADSHPVKTVVDRALDVLLMRAKTRVVGRNGVSVDGRMYWSERFFGLRGMECTVRWDPGDIGQVVVSVHEKGKADQVIIATSREWQDLAESNYERFRELKKQERRVVRDYVEQRQRAAEGITPYNQALMEAQARSAGVSPAVAINGTPVITPSHHLARAIEHAPKPVNQNRAGVSPAVAPPSRRQPLKLMPDREPANKRERPIFTTRYEKDQWEAEQRSESAVPELREPWESDESADSATAEERIREPWESELGPVEETD
jgi:hypothetical protein